MTNDVESRTPAWAWQAAALLVFVVAVRVIGYLPAVINPDESVFALAAREVLHGHLPYVTLFDNKPVGSTLLLAAVGGVLGGGIVPVRLLGTLAVWLSALLVTAIGRRGGLTGWSALLAGLLYAAFASTLGGLATLTEILATPFTAAAVLLLQRLLHGMVWRQALGTMALAGLAAGGGILVKLVPAVPCALVGGLVLVLLLRREGWSIGRVSVLGVVYALAAATPLLVTALVYAGAGALDTFLYSNIGFASAYTAHRPGIAAIAPRLVGVLADTWPLLVLMGLGMAVTAGRWREAWRDDLLLVALAWLAGELLGAMTSGFFYTHYFLGALAPVALLAMLGVHALSQWITGHATGQARSTAVIAALAILIPAVAVQMEQLRDLQDGDTARMIARRIKTASGGERRTLLVTTYPMTGLYSLTGAALPPTRYAVPAHLFSPQSRMIQGDPAVEITRVLASHPRFIVTGGDEKPPRRAAMLVPITLAAHYHPIYAHDGVTLFQLNGPVAGSDGPASRQPPL